MSRVLKGKRKSQMKTNFKFQVAKGVLEALQDLTLDKKSPNRAKRN
jgi:hypothetical protein